MKWIILTVLIFVVLKPTALIYAVVLIAVRTGMRWVFDLIFATVLKEKLFGYFLKEGEPELF